MQQSETSPVSCLDIVPYSEDKARLYIRPQYRNILDEWPPSAIHQIQTYEQRMPASALKIKIQKGLEREGIPLTQVSTRYADVWCAEFSRASLKRALEILLGKRK